MADADSDAAHQTKLERVIKQYGLEGLETELAARWTAPAGERESVRDLADFVNERVLGSALEEVGVDPLAGEVENYYRLLGGENVSAGRRTEARASLEQAGIDVAELEGDFVSHQAVHTYLTERAGLSYKGVSSAERLERTVDAIEQLEGRVQSVAEQNIENLTNADHLDVGDISVFLSLDIFCSECGEQYDFETLLKRGGCACSDPDDAT